MKTIFKYPVRPGTFTLSLPEGAEILSVQVQRGEPQMWIMLDPTAKAKDRAFQVFATGERIKELDSYKFIGTFQLEGGHLVFHLFEVL